MNGLSGPHNLSKYRLSHSTKRWALISRPENLTTRSLKRALSKRLHASQRVRIQYSDGDVLSYLELSMLGVTLGVGAIADDMSGWRDVVR